MSSRENQQVINFDQLDETSPILIHSRNVIIHPSSRTLDIDSKASNKITTKNVVDYSWEDRYTLGHLISYHPHTSLIAYVLSISNSYMIRILNEQHSSRCLIKDFSGEITDIAFSKSLIPYVASIDINGSVKVNKVIMNKEVIECQLILHIKAAPSLESVKSMKVSYSRVMWCWHNDSDQRGVEESDAVGTNISLLLGVVHGSTFEVMQIDTIESELLSQAEGGQYEPRIDRSGLRAISSSFQEQFFESENLSDLFLPYLIYTAPGDDSKITSLAISSDAAAFAVALRDGTVRFFTLDGSVKSGLKEAYSWRPFNGEAVWSLLFLDDCRPGNNIDSFWCHVVVGGAFNRELKLFRCDKWDCIQTVSFQSPITPCLLSAHIDQSARYLIMSDIRRKALYVLELDSIDNDKTKLFKNVQEFVLTQSLLSFDINTISSDITQDGGNQIIIKMFTITKGAFQKMRVTYMSRGHRLNEILVDMSDDGVDHETVGVPLDQIPVSTSLLTHVSSLPNSANSSFQDPAIISTMMHSNTMALKSGISGEIPTTLQHLFAVGTLRDDICNDNIRKIDTNDSGDESGDEASLVDIADEQDDEAHKSECDYKIFSDTVGGGDLDEQCGFPCPPYETNGTWNHEQSDNNLLVNIVNNENDIPMDSDEHHHHSNSNIVDNSLLVRMEALLLSQHQQLQTLTQTVHQLQRTIAQSNNQSQQCACNDDNRKHWTEHVVREIGGVCQKIIIDQLDHRLRDAIEMAIPRIAGDIGGRLDETVRCKLVALDSVTRDFLNGMLHDKKFISFLSNNMADCMDKPLRALYSDNIRKELVPALSRTLDKLFADTRDVLRDGIKDVLSSVNESNRGAVKLLEDKLISCVSSHQKILTNDMDNKLKQVINEVGNTRTFMGDNFNKQKDQFMTLTETMKTMRGNIYDNDVMCHNSHFTRGNSVMNINASQEQIAMREIKINRFIATGDYSSALNEALSMTDMRVLLSVCSRINTKKVLSGNPQKVSPLQSNSILALIQQLSREFQEQLDIKFEYLFDALLSLDTNDSGIKAHVSKVLKGVIRRLQTYLEQENSPLVQDKITVLLRLVTSRLDFSVPE